MRSQEVHPSSGIAKFLGKAAVLGAPLILAVGTYVVTDPFRVLRSYDFGDYYDEAAPVELNRDYVSMKLFWKYYPEQKFDSFIFGSSRSFPFHASDWALHLDGGHPFHWPAASENIYGISKKLTYLDRQGVQIRNAILEVGTGIAGAEPRYDATHRLPYELTGESWFDFQAAFLKSYFSEFYFLKHMDYAFTGRVRSYSRGALGIERGAVRIDPVTNEYYFASYDRAIERDPGAFYEARRADLPPRDRDKTVPPCADPVIATSQREILVAIHGVLAKQHTRYRVLLAPDYRQVCVNPADVEALRSIFGGSNVFDFTGVNEFTADRTNFYDSGHVRPEVAARVLARMYEHAPVD